MEKLVMTNLMEVWEMTLSMAMKATIFLTATQVMTD